MDVGLDENRAVDGLDLRRSYMDSLGRISVGPQDDLPCSILEMLVALSMRCNDWVVCDTDNHYSEWFWTYIFNLGLSVYDDLHYSAPVVDKILERWLNREISYDGSGGIFPLKNAEKDQRNIQIWDQMGFYLDENYF